MKLLHFLCEDSAVVPTASNNTMISNDELERIRKTAGFVCLFFFFLVSRGGVRLRPLGTSATNWPIVPATDDRWWWMCSSRWNENWQGRPKYSENTCPSATLSSTNPTWPDLGSNPGRRGGKPELWHYRPCLSKSLYRRSPRNKLRSVEWRSVKDNICLGRRRRGSNMLRMCVSVA
jgi:hypothetical protein